MSKTETLHDDLPSGHAPPASDHGYGHAEVDEPIGPVDVGAWTSAVLGGSIGLVVAVALAVATRS